jgi:hypothetical protein
MSLKKFRTGMHLYQAQKTYNKAGAEGRVQMSVRAPVEQVVAYVGAHALQVGKYHKSDRAATIVKRPNNHTVIVQQPVPLPSPLEDRELIGRGLWRKLDDDTFFVSQQSCEIVDCPHPRNQVRATFMRSFKLSRLGPNLTGFEMIGSMDLKGRVPRSVNEFATTPHIVASQINIMLYFTSVRSVDAFDEGDGTVLGQLMFLQLHPHRKNRDLLTEKILDMIRSINVLRSAQAKYR